MTEKLARRGLHVNRDYTPDYLQSALVRDAMTTAVSVLPSCATVQDARERIDRDAHSAFPLVDHDRRCVGIVSRQDLLDTDADGNTPVMKIASADVVTVSPDDTLLTVLEQIVDEHVEHVPVVDRSDQLVGICTRTDILRARDGHRAADAVQPGWRPRWRDRRAS
jgi:CBS domain-containing protein